MVGTKSGTDHTDTMNNWSGSRVEELRRQKLDGYIFKKASPSCGLFRIKVYDDKSIPRGQTRGLFAKVFTDALPLVPAEDEGRLKDDKLRENFIERIFAYRRWQQLLEDPSRPALMQFQADFKMTLMAHSPKGQRDIGRMVAESSGRPFDQVLEEYGRRFMEILTVVATPKSHTNALQHLMGFLKQHIDRDDKAELLEVLEDYRLGRLPLIVPVTLLKHHIRRSDTPDWLHRQTYLNPYPGELMLRNRI